MNYENQRLASVNETHETKIKKQEKYIEELDKELNRIKNRPPLEIGEWTRSHVFTLEASTVFCPVHADCVVYRKGNARTAGTESK